MQGIAIIGCGLIGETHAESLDSLGAEFRYFYDIDPERAEALAARFAGTVAKDLDQIFEDPGVTAVYICTHHDTHAPIAIQAAKSRKHIFLEKPMALTLVDCQAIVDAVEASGVKCMTGFKLRYYPLAQKAISLIKTPVVISAQVSDNRWPDDHWANDPIKGGGNILSQGCHAIDLVNNFANSKPIRVFAEGGNLHHPKNKITDALAITLTYESGAIASVTISDTSLIPSLGKFSFSVSDGGTSFLLYDRLLKLDVNTALSSEHYRNNIEEGFLRENKEFLNSLRDDRKPATDHWDGFRATAILLEAIESARTHEPRSLAYLR